MGGLDWRRCFLGDDVDHVGPLIKEVGWCHVSWWFGGDVWAIESALGLGTRDELWKIFIFTPHKNGYLGPFYITSICSIHAKKKPI